MATFSDRGSSVSISTCQIQDVARAFKKTVTTQKKGMGEDMEGRKNRYRYDQRLTAQHSPRTLNLCCSRGCETPPGRFTVR